MKTIFNHKRLDAFATCGSCLHVRTSTNAKNETLVSLIGNYCHDKFCEPCARARAQQIHQNIMEHIKDLERLKFVTLTRKHNRTPLTDQLKQLYSQFLNLRRSQWWKDHVKGGALFLEVKRSRCQNFWHPHLHLILEAKYMPQKELSQEWLRVTGDSHIVDVRCINDQRASASYVTKYVTKLASHDLTFCQSWLQELMSATRSLHTCAAFGSWRKLRLLSKPDDQRQWHDCGRLEHIWRKALEGDVVSRSIFSLLEVRFPLLVEMFVSRERAARPPPSDDSPAGTLLSG